MTPDRCPTGPEDERFVCVVTAEGVEALHRSATASDSEWAMPRTAAPDGRPSGAQD